MPAETAGKFAGVYRVHFGGQPCGEERWTLARTAAGEIATGEQDLRAPFPFPSTLRWRATVDPRGHVTSVDVDWQVGERRVRSEHLAQGERWTVRIESDGQVRQQEGDYPSQAVVVLGSHVFHTFVFRRLVLEPGADHVVLALTIGPPWMAVEPSRLHVTCTDVGTVETPLGPREARRIDVHDEERGPSDAFTAWIDAEDRVLLSREGPDDQHPWMTLVEYERGSGQV